VSQEYAQGITHRLQATVGNSGEIYPVAMYWFIVREAALKVDRATAATQLAAAHNDGRIQRLRDLPANEN
jgi:hypothetical protein